MHTTVSSKEIYSSLTWHGFYKLGTNIRFAYLIYQKVDGNLCGLLVSFYLGKAC